MKYLAYARSEFIRGFRYGANYWATISGSLVLVLVQWYLWHAVYRNYDALAGVSLNEMISYAMMARVISGFLGEPANIRIGERVRSGDIAHDLVKPVDLYLQILFQTLGRASFNLVTSGLPLFAVLYAVGVLRLPGPAVLLAFVVSVATGYLTLFCTSFASGILTFHTKSEVGLGHVYTVLELFSGLYFPLDFFPGWVGAVARFLPFGAIHYTPLAIWSGLFEPGEVVWSLCVQLAWALFMTVLSRALWWSAVRSLTIHGG